MGQGWKDGGRRCLLNTHQQARQNNLLHSLKAGGECGQAAVISFNPMDPICYSSLLANLCPSWSLCAALPKKNAKQDWPVLNRSPPGLNLSLSFAMLDLG